jgi:hypothetical protein
LPRLIEGNAVWGDQRDSSFLPAVPYRNRRLGHYWTSDSYFQPKFKGGWQMRTILTKALIALAITTIGALGADNSIGTWKLNAETSKYTPAPMPVKSLTVTREASDGGMKVTITGEQADGTAINATYTIKYDGKGVQVTGNSPYDTIAVKQVNDNTLTDTRNQTVGRYHATSRIVVSNDGKTMTTSTKGTNGEGKEFTSTFVFVKQ